MNPSAIAGDAPIDALGRWYAVRGKRLFDVVVTTAVLLLTWPVLLAIAIAIRLTSPGPVFFRQQRLGRNASVFEALKFRTMTHKERVPDTIRYTGSVDEVTAVGRLLRRFKLDELPQLFNVLGGTMSIVGPRPQLPIQLAEFNADARLRLLVRPGLTGMAQTHGNVNLTWPERWHYDAEYVRNVSLGLDLRLIARTFAVIILGEDRFTRHPPIERGDSR